MISKKNLFRKIFTKNSAINRGIIYFFLDSSFTGVFYFLSLYFHDVLGYPLTKATLLISAYGLGSILGGVLGGRCSDFISASGVSFFSCLVYGILFLFFQNNVNFYVLFVLIIGMGLCSSAFMTANNVWLLNLASESENAKARVQSLSSMSSNLGLAGSALLASLLIPHGYSVLFNVINIGIFSLSAIMGLDWVLEGNKPIYQNMLHHENHEVLRGFNADFIKLFVTLFFVGMVIAQMSGTYPVYLHDQFSKNGVQLFSYLFILNTLIVVLFQHPMTILFESLSPLKSIALSGLLLSIGFLILILQNQMGFLILSMLFYTLGEILFFTFSRVFCYDLAHPSQKGWALGWYRSVYSASRMLGVYLGGFIYHVKGSNFLFLFCIICSVVPLILPLFSKMEKN